MPPRTIPNKALRLSGGRARRANAAPSAAERRIDAAASFSWLAGYAVHSPGNHDDVRIEDALDAHRLRRQEQAVAIDRRLKPDSSSVTLRSAPSENTWKPPESVRIQAIPAHETVQATVTAITSSPGRSQRWKVFPRQICAPVR